MDRIPAGEGLPPSDGDVDVAGVDLQTVGTTAHTLCGHERGAGSAKGIEHDLSPPCAVLDRVRYQGDRLSRRVRPKLVHAAGAEAVDAGVAPDIRARAAMTAEFDVIEMGLLADPKDANQLMLAAIKATLASVGLDPHHQVDLRAVGLPASVDQLALVPPVHADIMECART